MASPIDTYFARLETAFSRAAQRAGGPRTVGLALAGRTIRFVFAGAALPPVLLPALAHLPEAGGGAADLEILCWDGQETGEPLPEPPWRWPEGAEPVRVALPAGEERHQLLVTPGRDTLALFAVETGRAVLWTAEARRLPTHWHGSPLVTLFHGWSRRHDLHLLHAGCVGTERGGVLLAGRGGSGKSTTALLGLTAGLRYVSDDYCLLAPGAEPRAHCLFSTGKLHRDHLPRFPTLAACAVDPQPDEFEKKVVFAARHFPDAVALDLPLRAVVLPRVAGRPETAWARISPAEALRGLAPSTLFQLPADDARGLRAMAGLVRQLPCFRLDLGLRLEAIAPAVVALLAETGT